MLSKQSLLGHSVQDTAGAPTTKKQSIRATQDFNLRQVIKWSVVLHVVTGTIDEEVGSRANPTEHDCVPVTFPLRIIHPGDVVDDVANRGKALLLNLIRSDD